MIAFGETSAVELLNDVERECHGAFAPRKQMGLIEHTERYRWLPKSTSSEEGPFRFARLPFLRKIHLGLESPRVGRVVLMKGSQVAGTTCAENWMHWTMTESIASMLSVWPTEKLFGRFSRERLEKMIHTSPLLQPMFASNGLREATDSRGHKEYPGGSLNIITARSASDLRSISVPRIHFSEVDALIAMLKEDGDPIELARSRGETFYDFKEFLESTPLLDGASRIYEELETTTWNEWHMPCPFCEKPQVLRWRDGMEDGDYDRAGSYRFVWDEDTAGQVIPASVHYVCEGCDKLIAEHWKEPMLEAGDWVERFPGRIDWGFHLPSFPSPLISWTRIAQRFVRAKRSDTKMQTFVNNICGLPYKSRASRISKHFLQQRVETYRAAVPKGVRFLVVGGDVQGDRVELAVWGIGAGEEMWLIAWIRIEGEPGLEKTWRDVGEELRTPFRDELGRAHYIAVGCIDTKYQSEAVKRFCAKFRGYRGARMIPIMGKEGRGRPVIEEGPALTRRRTRAKKPSRMVGTDTVKDLLAERLAVTEPGPEYVHFPASVDPGFFDQLTGEELKTVYIDKRPVRKWKKKSQDQAVEALDCTVYAYAALVSLGGKILSELATLGIHAGKQKQLAHARAALLLPPSEEPAPRAAVKVRKRPRINSGDAIT